MNKLILSLLLIAPAFQFAHAETLASGGEARLVPVARTETVNLPGPQSVHDDIRDTLSVYKEWAQDKKSKTGVFWRDVVCGSTEAFDSMNNSTMIEAKKLAAFRSQIRERLRSAAHNSEATRERIIADWKKKPDKGLALECTLAVVLDQSAKAGRPCKFSDGEDVYFRPLQSVCAQLTSAGSLP